MIFRKIFSRFDWCCSTNSATRPSTLSSPLLMMATRSQTVSTSPSSCDEKKTVLHPADMEFHFQAAYPDKAIPEAYERLLLDAITGDAALFMRSDEIERSWEIMEPFLIATERPDAPKPEIYPVGSHGPACAGGLLEREGRKLLMLRHLK